tara:strand:- start:6315 stop:7400 length:1086 start_codon:yes stop_codon:yes gene_type:complete
MKITKTYLILLFFVILIIIYMIRFDNTESFIKRIKDRARKGKIERQKVLLDRLQDKHTKQGKLSRFLGKTGSFIGNPGMNYRKYQKLKSAVSDSKQLENDLSRLGVRRNRSLDVQNTINKKIANKLTEDINVKTRLLNSGSLTQNEKDDLRRQLNDNTKKLEDLTRGMINRRTRTTKKDRRTLNSYLAQNRAARDQERYREIIRSNNPLITGDVNFKEQVLDDEFWGMTNSDSYRASVAGAESVRLYGDQTGQAAKSRREALLKSIDNRRGKSDRSFENKVGNKIREIKKKQNNINEKKNELNESEEEVSFFRDEMMKAISKEDKDLWKNAMIDSRKDVIRLRGEIFKLQAELGLLKSERV